MDINVIKYIRNKYIYSNKLKAENKWYKYNIVQHDPHLNLINYSVWSNK